MTGRLPDFVVIGALKSGTTSLFQTIGGYRNVALPDTKEINFFSNDERWARGVAWYASLFPPRADAITGEASPAYTNPRHAETVADRMKSVVPSARLVCILRDPVERMRSHFRHEVQRGREHRPFAAALGAGSIYVERSLYDRALAPYVERFDRAQLCVVRTEDVDGSGSRPGWTQIVDFLGLEGPGPIAMDHVNTTATKAQFTPAALTLFRRGWLRAPRRTPAVIRRTAKRVLLRDRPAYRELLETSAGEVPAPVLAEVRSSAERLAALLGDETLRWDH